MKNLTTLPQKSEITIREYNLKSSLAVAFERTNTPPFNLDKLVSDVLSEFPRVSDNDITLALRSGSLGKYGRTFKLSTQEVCYWIREYQKSKTKKSLL